MAAIILYLSQHYNGSEHVPPLFSRMGRKRPDGWRYALLCSPPTRLRVSFAVNNLLCWPRNVEGNVCNPSWTQGMNQSSITYANPTNAGSTTPTHSPAFVEGSASNLTSPEIPYLPRHAYSALPRTVRYPHRFHRSPPSTMTSPFQFPFPENPVPNDSQQESNSQRHLTNGAQCTPYSGTAHISVVTDEEYH